MAHHRRVRPALQALLYLCGGAPALLSALWSELLHTYAQIRALCGKLGRAPYIYLTGGGPILHPDFWRLLELFKADGTRPAPKPRRAGRSLIVGG